MVGHGGSSAGSYLADPTSPIHSHCASIVATSTLRVNLLQVLCTEGLPPQQKAGALHMIGAVADVLLNKKIYKEQAEAMIVNHVFKEFGSEFGYLRARVGFSLVRFGA